MAPARRELPAKIQAAIEQINNVKVSADSQILTSDQLKEVTDRYTKDLRPGTFLIGNAQEEEELAKRSATRQIDGVEFDAPVAFGFPGDDEDEEDDGEDPQIEPMVSLNVAGNEDIEDEDNIPDHNNPDRKFFVNGSIWHVAEYLGKDWVDMIVGFPLTLRVPRLTILYRRHCILSKRSQHLPACCSSRMTSN